MPYQEVELRPGLFLWRCDECGAEHPKIPVPKHQLGSAPHHNCPNAGRLAMESILAEQAAAAAPTLHLGDIVEEIATNRPGKIDAGPTQSTAGPIAPNWRVIFTDNKKPLYKYFNDEKELRVKWCPHNERGNMGK
jgi:hypothetical protein